MKPLTIFFGMLVLLASPVALAADYATVDHLLDAIEQADEGLSTIQAEVQYDRHLEIQNDRILRRGTIYYSVDGKNKKFAVRFTERIVDRIPRAEDETIIFDGRWVVERREDIKQFVKREIAREGDDFDPLRLGEGPFPIPIGQKKSDILRTYSASMPECTEGLDPDEEADLIALLADAHQLHLVPHDLENADLTDVRLWYREQGSRLVPRMARTVNRRGDIAYVLLINARVNVEIPAEALEIEPPDAEDGWDVQVFRLPREDAGSGMPVR